jgi:nicotinate-nucleotide adenylyltransferase
MTQSRAVMTGVFGGTFDPVHYGHLRTAFELRERVGLREVRFVPCAHPPHREAPAAPARLRLAMLEAALEGEPTFCIDRRELERPGPSYSIDTLESLHDEFPDRTLCLLLGLDAFLGIPSWKDWERLFEFAHIVVALRPGSELPTTGSVAAILKDRVVGDADTLHAQQAGAILVVPVTQLEISSTLLRESIREGLRPKYLMPKAVWRIIEEAGCYAGEIQ